MYSIYMCTLPVSWIHAIDIPMVMRCAMLFCVTVPYLTLSLYITLFYLRISLSSLSHLILRQLSLRYLTILYLITLSELSLLTLNHYITLTH